MDVNGTRLLLRWSGEMLRAATDLEHVPELGALILQREVFQFPADTATPALPQRAASADRDRFGHWYWIEAGSEIRFLPAGQRHAELFWPPSEAEQPPAARGAFVPAEPPADPAPAELRGLVVTEDHTLVVGTLQPAGLLVFDLYAGGPPRQLCWPLAIPFDPIDLALRPAGGVWVLDRGGDAGPRYWAVDRHQRVVGTDLDWEELQPERPHDFHPDGGEDRPASPAVRFPTGISLELSSPLEASEPIAIEALADGTVLVLDNPEDATYSRIARYGPDGRIGLAFDFENVFAETLPSTAAAAQSDLRAIDIALQRTGQTLEGDVTATLFAAAASGQQAYAFELRADDAGLDLQVVPRYFPMRLFEGRAFVGRQETIFYDLGDRFASLTERPKPRFKSGGWGIAGPFDGQRPGTVWHRLCLDGRIPAGTSLQLESRTAEHLEELESAPWEPEPAPYLRGTGWELPHWRPSNHGADRRTGTWELLLQAARGRYLELRFRLTGNGRASPSIQALRIHFPRFSYLTEYLPAAFRDDPVSASFLERFLANGEGTWTTLEGRIAAAEALIDVRSAPADLLDWLAGWMGVVFEPDWESWRRRWFLRNAVTIFRERGTVRGLLRLLRIATDPCADPDLFDTDPMEARHTVRLIEHFLTRRQPGVMFGDPSAATAPMLLEPDDPWEPAHGGAALHARYREAIGTTDVNVIFAALPPVEEPALQRWRSFVRGSFAFPYAEVVPDELTRYRRFLRERYCTIDALKQAHSITDLSLTAFEELELPAEGAFVEDGAPLRDWIDFVSRVVPTSRAAHWFSVLVPARPEETDDIALRRLNRARAIIEREKPAHTDFEVRLFWDVFRVGEARLGIDTELGRGSRFFALVLGQSHVGDSFLPGRSPWAVRERMLVGRDPATRQGPLA